MEWIPKIQPLIANHVPHSKSNIKSGFGAGKVVFQKIKMAFDITSRNF